jgi:hypothetical protein
VAEIGAAGVVLAASFGKRSMKNNATLGQIWKAKKTVLANKTGISSKEHNRRVVIEENELVEFRYWSPAHVRTCDASFLVIQETEFYESFEQVGIIFEEVRWRNKNSTKEILDARLYHEMKPDSGEVK